MRRTNPENNYIHEVNLAQDIIGAFRGVPLYEKGFVLINLSKSRQKMIINSLKSNEIIELLHYIDPDDATDIIQQIRSRRRREHIIDRLSEDIKDKVNYLMKFDPSSAAGIMSLDYIEVHKDITFGEVSRQIETHEKRTGKLPAILVVEEDILLGEVQMHNLGLCRKNERVARYITKIPSIEYNKAEQEIIKRFKKHPHSMIAVLDEDRSIMGVIYSDDILKIIQKQSDHSLYDFAGVSREEDVYDSALVKVRYRWKWLVLNLGTAFLAASVISFFQETISAFVLLAVYMPIIAGMGGNAGTQTMAVIIRGITLKEIEIGSSKKVIGNEMLAGAANGTINGMIVAGIATVFNQDPMFGAVVGIAMIINLVIAGLFGAIIPVMMKSLGKDPATSATIFITTATDVFGFLVFLGLATLML